MRGASPIGGARQFENVNKGAAAIEERCDRTKRRDGLKSRMRAATESYKVPMEG